MKGAFGAGEATRRGGARSICVLLCAPLMAWADLGATGTTTSTARLDFILNIGKFIYFRVGGAAFPAATGTVDTISFNAVAAIPPSATVPVTSNKTGVNWNGALPTLTATASSLPVELRSNAGQISIRAAAISALASGTNAIPLSQIVLTSSDVSFPAPVVPNTGSGPAVSVAGTSFSNLVTVRSASWSFSYSPLITQPAGIYAGQISFTASSP